jgi:hypothetical protein
MLLFKTTQKYPGNDWYFSIQEMIVFHLQLRGKEPSHKRLKKSAQGNI